MNTNSLISKFIAQLCEKQYAYANSTLASIVEAKLKGKIKKEADKLKSKKDKKSKDFFAQNKKMAKKASDKNK